MGHCDLQALRVRAVVRQQYREDSRAPRRCNLSVLALQRRGEMFMDD